MQADGERSDAAVGDECALDMGDTGGEAVYKTCVTPARSDTRMLTCCGSIHIIISTSGCGMAARASCTLTDAAVSTSCTHRSSCIGGKTRQRKPHPRVGFAVSQWPWNRAASAAASDCFTWSLRDAGTDVPNISVRCETAHWISAPSADGHCLSVSVCAVTLAACPSPPETSLMRCFACPIMVARAKSGALHLRSG